jgi:hypothetical protein
MNQKAGIICSCKINNTEYFLCVMNKNTSKWGFPKGLLDENESVIDCAMREFEKETGIFINLTGKENMVNLSNNNTQYFLYNFDTLKEPKKFDSGEIIKTKWLSVMKLLGTDFRIMNSDLKYFVQNNLNKYCDSEFSIVVKKQKPRRGSTLCQNFINGFCKYGKKCNFYHVK